MESGVPETRRLLPEGVQGIPQIPFNLIADGVWTFLYSPTDF